MNLLSDASEYGLRAVVWLAQNPGRPRKTREIAEGTRAAQGYLIKVLQDLSKAGILSAQRGTNGGFTLQRDPAGLPVLEVLNAIDPLERIHTCPLGLESHGRVLCPMHRRIDDAVATIQAGFAASTIADLLNEPTSSQPLCEALTVRDGAGSEPPRAAQSETAER